MKNRNTSPGVYGTIFSSSYRVPTYMLSVSFIYNTPTQNKYKWKIAEVDKNWRDSWEGKKLPRDLYTIQYSLDLINIVGSYQHYLNDDITITINVSA
jgi:hypothetical protein